LDTKKNPREITFKVFFPKAQKEGERGNNWVKEGGVPPEKWR